MTIGRRLRPAKGLEPEQDLPQIKQLPQKKSQITFDSIGSGDSSQAEIMKHGLQM